METTRRKMLLNAMSLLAVPYLGKAQPIKSAIGAKSNAFDDAEQPISAKSYIRKGLVFQVDGIENVGFKQHDSNSTVWKDLTGNFVLQYEGGEPQFSDDALITRAGFNAHSESIPVFDEFTCECVYARGEGIAIAKFNAMSYGYMIFGSAGRGAFYTPVQNRVCVCGNLNATNLLNGSGIHSCVGTFNGETCNAYINGIVFAEEQTPYAKGSGAAWAMLSIGALYGTSYSADGKVYAIRIYNRPLTYEEITFNYEIDKRRFNVS